MHQTELEYRQMLEREQEVVNRVKSYSNVTNSRQEADQQQRKEVAEQLKKMTPDQKRGFANWINELIVEDD